MMRSLATGVALLIALAVPARAHQLDEYVQASKISVGKDRVTVELRLTPGVKVLSRVLAAIDPNGDGVISPDEQRAYAERVRRDLSLRLDGTRLPLRLVAVGFPSIDEMKEGLGEIRLDFDAAVPAGASNRRLTFENHHQRDIAVYLANVLVPQDADIRISAQRRSYKQSSFTLDYVQSGPSTPVEPTRGGSGRGPWLVVGLALLALIANRRVRFVSRIQPFGTRG